MTIVLTGGGSGGHITPLMAVAAEIKRREPKVRLVYIGQTGDGLGDIPAQNKYIDQVYTVRAGKFRRYHGEGFKQLLDLPTTFKNARDAVYVVIGWYQSRRLLKQLWPALIFVKGGFVGVPVGLAAAQLHIPYITHDSDAIPGLANRIISRWARLHTVALPKEAYNYPTEKTITTGIPLQNGFVPVSKGKLTAYRKKIGVPVNAKLLFVIGGGLGAQRINDAVADALPHLLRQFKDLHVVHGVGRKNEASMKAVYKARLSTEEQDRLKTYGYINNVYDYSGAADVIITRAGATNLAEFALQGKACVVVPSPFLAGGHQLRNAEYLAEQGAVQLLNEVDLLADPLRLAVQVSDLLKRPKRCQELAEALAEFAQPHATEDIAKLLLAEATV